MGVAWILTQARPTFSAFAHMTNELVCSAAKAGPIGALLREQACSGARALHRDSLAARSSPGSARGRRFQLLRHDAHAPLLSTTPRPAPSPPRAGIRLSPARGKACSGESLPVFDQSPAPTHAHSHRLVPGFSCFPSTARRGAARARRGRLERSEVGSAPLLPRAGETAQRWGRRGPACVREEGRRASVKEKSS